MNDDPTFPPREGGYQLLLSGLDTLEVSYFLHVPSSALDLEDLEERKERLKADYGDGFDKVRLGTETFALKPYGRSKYKFVLTNKSFEILLAEHMSPSCRVKFFSQALWHEGLQGLTERFERWRRSVSLSVIQPEVVGRADWAFDYHVPVVDFDWDDFVSRAKKDNAYRASGIVQTFQFGKGDIVVRVYDKVAEIEEKSGKVWFYDLWGRNSQAWRIEFQVRREALKARGINTLEDLQDYQGDALFDLATNHTTLRKLNSDSNRSRWPLHPLWDGLQRHIEGLPRTGLVRAFDEKKLLDYRLYKQSQGIYGYLKGLAALESIRTGKPVPVSMKEILESLRLHIEGHHHSVPWQADVKKRIRAYEVGQW
jgi:hypothetical protein